MAQPFSITAASNSVFLDDDRTGTAEFTVSNQSGRSLGGRAQLVTEDPEAESWVTLQDSAHQEFATAGTRQYTADIDVPPEAPSGNYNLRLDVVGEERPDEQYVQGPTVTFEVPEAKQKSEPFPWTTVAAVVGVLVLLGGGWLAYQWLFTGVTVPKVSGEPVDKAEISIREENLEPRVTRQHSESVPEDTVIKAKPSRGKEIDEGASVELYVSSGPELIRIPNVEGDSLVAASEKLREEGFELSGEVQFQNSSETSEWLVIETEPEAGVSEEKGARIQLVVSTGPSSSNGGGGLEPIPLPQPAGSSGVFPGANGVPLPEDTTLRVDPHILDSLGTAPSNR